jgi:hypothetical protein
MALFDGKTKGGVAKACFQPASVGKRAQAARRRNDIEAQKRAARLLLSALPDEKQGNARFPGPQM